MKLATLSNDTRDGRLAVVSRDLTTAAPADHIARTMQDAIERWAEVEPALRQLSSDLEAGKVQGAIDFTQARPLAPLPRAWQWLDGSTFASHAELMNAVFGHKTDPRDYLMYQGMSHCFLSPTEDVKVSSEDDNIDFEGEFGVVIGEVRQGATVEEAAASIRMAVQINDWSLRGRALREIKIGFGWIHAKPACSVAPVAVTLDELGPAWRDGRIDLNLLVDWNGKRFGAANGYAMAYSFAEMIAYAAETRPLCAGTIIGSGTVSNANFREVGSSCIAERRGIEVLDNGAAITPFMSFGDSVRMEALLPDGSSVFGAIDQKVVQATR